MVRCSHFVFHSILCKETLKLAVAKVRTTITNYSSGSSKTSEDISTKKLGDHSSIIGWSGNCFDPLGYVIDSNQNIFIAKRGWKWAHKINAPNIEKLNLNDVCEQHFISVTYVPCSLTTITLKHKHSCIFEKSRPK